MSLIADDKTNGVIENAPEENITNSQGKVKATTPTIKYKGTVTVKYVDKKGRVKRIQKGHNEGKQGLFTLITQSLCRYSGAPSYAPTYIMGYYKDDNDNEKKAFFDIISMAGTPVIYDSDGRKADDRGVSVQFSFLIQNVNLMQSIKPIIKLCLVNGHYNDDSGGPANSICATFEYEDEGDAISTNTTNNIVIYWLMSFSDVSDLNNDD